ncbi:MAG TPA: hypothetical protein VHV10_20490, partial [Ktedonobacteraceae bacterium]|nr:hypothetical protein [Ktedonobacteraceae bacterium]
SAAITKGLNHSNIIAVVANGSAFDLYVNHQKIARTNDSSLSGGSLGVTAGNSQVAYTNARIWTL